MKGKGKGYSRSSSGDRSSTFPSTRRIRQGTLVKLDEDRLVRADPQWCTLGERKRSVSGLRRHVGKSLSLSLSIHLPSCICNCSAL